MKILLFTMLMLITGNLFSQPSQESPLELRKQALLTFRPLSLPQVDLPKAMLGEKLYHLKDLSKNKTISCNSCHNISTFGVDNAQFSQGHDKSLGGRNAPTTFNAHLNFVQFWDGRAKNLEEQAKGPVLNPIEHGLTSALEAEKILHSAGLGPEFKKVFSNKDPAVTFDHFAQAVAEFERTLVTPSRFDDFLKGNNSALNQQEQRGLKKFMDLGCIACHSGEGIGGESFQKLGLVKEYPTKDLGRFDITKKEEDKFHFKVPLLRNIEKTAPYFHDGSIKTLKEAITIMGRHQLGVELSGQDVQDLEAFLKSLTGVLVKK